MPKSASQLPWPIAAAPVPGTGGALGGADRQSRFAIGRTGDHRRAGSLGDLERLAREVGFVHRSVFVMTISSTGQMSCG